MQTFNFWVQDGDGCNCGLPHVIDLGYVIWKFSGGKWHVVKNCCKSGCAPGGEPNRPGEFDGHLRALPCYPSSDAIDQDQNPDQHHHH